MPCTWKATNLLSYLEGNILQGFIKYTKLLHQNKHKQIKSKQNRELLSDMDDFIIDCSLSLPPNRFFYLAQSELKSEFEDLMRGKKQTAVKSRVKIQGKNNSFIYKIKAKENII